MATPAPFLSEIAKEGPVLNLLNNHLRELREKLNRISQIEESRAHGKTLNKEQEETLRSKPYAVARIDELEKIRQPLLSAVDQEIKLVLAKCGSSREIATEIDASAEPEGKEQSGDDSAVSDLLNLLYFVRLFDLETLMRADENVVRRTKERNYWLTYDSVRKYDNGGDRLKEFDLNLIAKVGGLLISRPVNSSLSHKESLEKCAEHAKLWLANADQPIEAASTITYAGLRKKINRIMASHYFTTTPEIKTSVYVAAAAAGNVNTDGSPPNFGKNQYPGGNTYPSDPPYPDNAYVGTGRPLTPPASQNYYQFCYGWGYDPHYGGEVYRPSMLGTPPVRVNPTLFQRPIRRGEPSPSKEDPTPPPKGKGKGKAVEMSQPGLDMNASKRTRLNRSGGYSNRSGAEPINLSEAQEPFTLEDEAQKSRISLPTQRRPMGVKAVKRKGKAAVSGSSEAQSMMGAQDLAKSVRIHQTKTLFDLVIANAAESDPGMKKLYASLIGELNRDLGIPDDGDAGDDADE